MSFPFNLGQHYVCGAGTVVCTEWERELTIFGALVQTFTIKAYGDVFHDLSTPPESGPASRPIGVAMDNNTHDGTVAVHLGVDVQAGQLVFSNGTTRPLQPSPIAPPAARTPACLVDALCRRGRFLTLPTPPPGETGA